MHLVAIFLFRRNCRALRQPGNRVIELGTRIFLIGARIVAGTCTFTPFKKRGPVAVDLENRVKGAFGVAVVPNVIR
jgi:hypothetical protein